VPTDYAGGEIGWRTGGGGSGAGDTEGKARNTCKEPCRVYSECTPLPARYGIPCYIQCAPYREGRCGVLCRRKAWMKEFRPDEMKWKSAHTHKRGHVYMYRYVTAVRRKRRPG